MAGLKAVLSFFGCALLYPLEIIKFLHDHLLNQNGVLFFNRIPIYKDVWQKFAGYLQAQGVVFGFKIGEEPSVYRKAGITYASFGVRKFKADLPFPLIPAGPCRDYFGNQLITQAYQFDSRH